MVNIIDLKYIESMIFVEYSVSNSLRMDLESKMESRI